jgi:hypothetical protein
MALQLRLANTAANAEANALATLANTGYIRIYDSTGTGQPANADTAVTTQVLLAELRFGATAFGSAAAGVITANAITADSSANASGTATWFRVLQSDGTTTLWDGSVGTATCDLILNSVAITTGLNVSITSLVHTVTKQ